MKTPHDPLANLQPEPAPNEAAVARTLGVSVEEYRAMKLAAPAGHPIGPKDDVAKESAIAGRRPLRRPEPGERNSAGTGPSRPSVRVALVCLQSPGRLRMDVGVTGSALSPVAELGVPPTKCRQSLLPAG